MAMSCVLKSVQAMPYALHHPDPRDDPSEVLVPCERRTTRRGRALCRVELVNRQVRARLIEEDGLEDALGPGLLACLRLCLLPTADQLRLVGGEIKAHLEALGSLLERSDIVDRSLVIDAIIVSAHVLFVCMGHGKVIVVRDRA